MLPIGLEAFSPGEEGPSLVLAGGESEAIADLRLLSERA